MPKVESYLQGTPSWVDLSTKDQEGAKKFYSELFGWEYEDNPMGNGMTYSMGRIDGSSVAAIYQQQQGEADLGLPSHWNVYITVNDVDAIAAQAKEKGCMVFAEPMDVFEAGRMCVLQDPTGAQIQFWTPIQHIGAEIRDEHGALTWAELLTTDQEGAGEFYTGLLGIGIDKETMPTPEGDPYHMLMTSQGPVAGVMPLPEHLVAQGVPSHWEVYFRVDDANEAVEKATSMGAQVLFGPEQIPMVGTFAVFMDPQGAAFGIQQPPTG